LTVSLGRVTQGLALGVSAGIALALVAGLSKVDEEVADAPLQMLRTVQVGQRVKVGPLPVADEGG
jgi:sulfonate transport system permease protein